MIRDDIKAALVAAMKGGDKAATRHDPADPVGDQEPRHRASHRRARRRTTTLLVTEVLQKMIKQRRESVDLYRKGNREELAATEEAEIAVIERFLPAQMSDDEASAAIQAIIAETGASSMKDMGTRHGRGEGAPRQRRSSLHGPARW